MLWLWLRRVRSSNPETRRKAIRAIAGSTDPRAAGAFADAHRDADERVRCAVAEVLGQRASVEGDRLLRLQLRDDSAAVRGAAVAALADRAPSNPEARVLCAFARGARQNLVALGGAAVPVLAEFLSSADPTTRELSAETLGEIGDPAAIAKLLESSPRVGAVLVQKSLTTILDKTGEDAEREIERVVKLLWEGKQWNSVEQATLALEWIGIRGVPGLLAIASFSGRYDQPTHLCRSAREAIKRIGPAAANPLAKRLGSTPADDVELLLQDMKEGAVPALVTTLESTRAEARLAAALLLEHVKWLPTTPRQAALQALGYEGAYHRIARFSWEDILRQLADDAVREIEMLALDSHFSNRAGAVRALGAIAGRGVVSFELLSDEDPSVRAAAAAALGERREGGALDSLTGVLADNEPAVRAAAAKALGGIGAEAAVEPLIAALANGVDAAEEALAAIQQRSTTNSSLVTRIDAVLQPRRVAATRSSVERLLAEIEADRARGDRPALDWEDRRRFADVRVRELDRLLEADVANASSEALRRIASMTGVFALEQHEVLVAGQVDDYRLVAVPVDTSSVRRRAQEELERRKVAQALG